MMKKTEREEKTERDVHRNLILKLDHPRICLAKVHGENRGEPSLRLPASRSFVGNEALVRQELAKRLDEVHGEEPVFVTAAMVAVTDDRMGQAGRRRRRPYGGHALGRRVGEGQAIEPLGRE